LAEAILSVKRKYRLCATNRGQNKAVEAIREKWVMGINC